MSSSSSDSAPASSAASLVAYFATYSCHVSVLPAFCDLGLTLNLRLITLGFPHKQGSRFAIQGICWVWVAEELRQKDLKYVNHVEHRRPRLVDDVETHRSGSEEQVRTR